MRAVRLVILLLVAALIAPNAAGAELEHGVKAAFLYKFLSFVEWPENSFEDTNTPIAIGVLGADDVAEALEDIVEGRQAQGRPVAVRRLKGGDPLGGVHLLFVGRGSADELARVAGHPGVLIVSDSDGALDRGSMINLVRAGDNVRFEVAPATAERSGLHISSRMLAIALQVKRDRP